MTRTITIIPVLNGFICKVDCQQIVFVSADSMLLALKAYYADPKNTEELYIKSAINQTIGPVAPAPECASARQHIITAGPIEFRGVPTPVEERLR